MCNYFSCIIDRRLRVYWDETTVQHEKLIKKSGWKDNKLKDRDFVRIEIVPKDPSKITRNKEEWEYRVDEEDSLPVWYIHNDEKCMAECWKVWEESVKINVAIEFETITTNGNYILAFDSAQVKAFDSAQVEASGSAQVKASGSAQVEASGSAQVKASGSAQVEAFGSAQVEAFGSAQVEAFGSAQVKAFGSAQVEAFDSAQVMKKSSACKITLHSDTAVITDYYENKIIVTHKAQVVRVGKVE